MWILHPLLGARYSDDEAEMLSGDKTVTADDIAGDEDDGDVIKEGVDVL